MQGADEGRVGVGGQEPRGPVRAERGLEEAGQAGGGGAFGDVGELGRQLPRRRRLALQGGDRFGRGELGAAPGGDRGEDGVEMVAVVDGDVETVGARPAGQLHVDALAVRAGGGQRVRGVDGHALGAVDGGGVAELAVRGEVGGGQADAAAVLGVAGDDVAARPDPGEGPGVAVLHEVPAAAHGHAAPVEARDDRVADMRLLPGAQRHDAGGVEGAGLEVPCLRALVQYGHGRGVGGRHQRGEALSWSLDQAVNTASHIAS
ncbi:hypothetical protein AB0E77_32055 [Streptomyces sp. NPDC032940]|uniref:hypothetical protein n=1 Tax=Streptomyces sp. NPDC032940 TaxID=3155366 RepID=UPI0033E2DF76